MLEQMYIILIQELDIIVVVYNQNAIYYVEQM